MKQWLKEDTEFIPVPLHRVLEDIKNLFRDEWLRKNDAYGFRESLDGKALRELFKRHEKDYCKNFLEVFLNDDCTNKGI